MKQVLTPNFGLVFLQIVKEHSRQTKIKDKQMQAIKIYIFSICAIEALANYVGMNILSSIDLNKFVRGNPPGYKKTDRRSELLKKWEFILNYYKLPQNKITQHLKNIKKVVDTRNDLIHFKPHKNQTEKILLPAKKKLVGHDGLLYTSFLKTGGKVIKNGVLNKINIATAKNDFNEIDKLVFDFYKISNVWPPSEFCNKYWKTKSPSWRYRSR